ncbi:uncharacterized protein J3D65DRAFT_52214 [Phyllosticta citribraziliensis]|uniref:Uncharacterized protein n=1 Tax=Phyllosticta citribraziliensis TaxID=989973 RepID=A0ABR1LFY2_9PEZI
MASEPGDPPGDSPSASEILAQHDIMFEKIDTVLEHVVQAYADYKQLFKEQIETFRTSEMVPSTRTDITEPTKWSICEYSDRMGNTIREWQKLAAAVQYFIYDMELARTNLLLMAIDFDNTTDSYIEKEASIMDEAAKSQAQSLEHTKEFKKLKEAASDFEKEAGEIISKFGESRKDILRKINAMGAHAAVMRELANQAKEASPGMEWMTLEDLGASRDSL